MTATKARTILPFLLASALVSSCSGGGQAQMCLPDTDCSSAPLDSQGQKDRLAGAETSGGEDQLDFGHFDLPLGEVPLVPEDVGPVIGGFGWPCEEHDDCDSGFCLPTVEGALCTVQCIEECPDAAWSCEYISLGGPDEMFACVPPVSSVCRPCHSDADCTLVEGETARCAPYGDVGWFCSPECVGNGDCSDGYICGTFVLADGPAKGCIAESGDCPCLPGFLGLTTECHAGNDAGICFGLRSCTKGAQGMEWAPCTAAVPMPEECNGLDDDCNGFPDDGLGEVDCGKGICKHLVLLCDNGTSEVCDPFAGAAAESCNGLDDDCDGDTDEIWAEKGDDCDGNDSDECQGGTLACAEDGESLVCAGDDFAYIEECNGLDDDCDGVVDEEDDLGSATCGEGICQHTEPNCQDGELVACDAYAGAEQSDLPDLDYVDSNCDGVDGLAVESVFVDVLSGNADWPGTRDEPLDNIDAALALAEDEGKEAVLVSMGAYSETVTLRNGIGLFGQYDAASGWTRSVENTTQIMGGTRAVVADGIFAATSVQGFLIVSQAASVPGESSYGVFVHDSPGLVLEGNVIQGGAGASGETGVAGQIGGNGSSGSNGGQGCKYGCYSEKWECLGCLGLGVCGSCVQPGGGSGGDSPCGSVGGKGGDGGVSEGSGSKGAGGQGSGAGTGGAGGAKSKNGSPGTPGAPGGKGPDGGAGLAFGLAAVQGYIAADGVNGANGLNGGGGGGGGAGGGETYLWPDCCKTYGSSGGGGGGGGCLGSGGKGGGGGGGSFGLYVAGGAVQVISCTIKTGTGGPGGAGGSGGKGGTAGIGGQPGAKGDDDNQGVGGAGGAAGVGGDGGNGGGGGGGPSVGVVCAPGASASILDAKYQLGLPGAGGMSTGNIGGAGEGGEVRGCE